MFYNIILSLLLILSIIYCLVSERQRQLLSDLNNSLELDNELKTMEIRSLKQDLKTYKEIVEKGDN